MKCVAMLFSKIDILSAHYVSESDNLDVHITCLAKARLPGSIHTSRSPHEHTTSRRHHGIPTPWGLRVIGTVYRQMIPHRWIGESDPY